MDSLAVETSPTCESSSLTDGDPGDVLPTSLWVFRTCHTRSWLGWQRGGRSHAPGPAAAGCGAVALGWFTGILLYATWNGTAVLSGVTGELFGHLLHLHPRPVVPLVVPVHRAGDGANDATRRKGLMPYVAQGRIVPSESRWCADLKLTPCRSCLGVQRGRWRRSAMKQFMHALPSTFFRPSHQAVKVKNRGPEQARIEESRELR